MYLTNSKQVVAQEKLAAIFNGQENFQNDEIVFASESRLFDLREIFNDTPIFDNLMEQVLPEENISLIDSEPEIFGYLEIENINVNSTFYLILERILLNSDLGIITIHHQVLGVM